MCLKSPDCPVITSFPFLHEEGANKLWHFLSKFSQQCSFMLFCKLFVYLHQEKNEKKKSLHMKILICFSKQVKKVEQAFPVNGIHKVNFTFVP
jgi:hypothetical protein